MEVPVGPPTVTIHADDEFAVCELNAEMSSTKEQGYFAADTRLVSGYRLKLGRARPVLCNAAAIGRHAARFEFTNPALLGAHGQAIVPQCLHLRLDRAIGHGLHEDYELTNYSREPVTVDLEVSLESDFADLFDVKGHRSIRRGWLGSTWNAGRGRLLTTYRNGAFTRGLIVEVADAGSPPAFANGGLLFRVAIDPRCSWHTCLLWRPVLDGAEPGRPPRACHDLAGQGEADRFRRDWVSRTTRYLTGDPAVDDTVRQAVEDLAGMRMRRHDVAAAGGGERDADAWVPAAGIPWFVTLFGRDALTVSFQTLSLSPRFALGSLHALAALQADATDDRRDMQPGKIEHEVRHGELAALHLIPHTPYYGTHEATPLFVLVTALAWGWHGNRVELDRLRPHVERALGWVDTDGDLDGDGLQEYRTRSPQGYYNQGWKDAGDAIVGADGERSKLPIALCEHQGLVAAAKRAWADVLETVYQERSAATRLRDQADRLVEAIETRFWWEEEGTYYLGLDGDKRPIDSVASNPAHLLWQRVVRPQRAERVARRLLAPDMWSGWGIRTLSAAHPAYNPFSYQLGSVWPHDNAIAAAGFLAYGLDGEAARVARAILDAADRFAARRLPELFSGLSRDPDGFPVQYLGANVPQAWASGAVVHLLAALLGLEADAAAHRLRLRPALPDWLPEVRLERLAVGEASLTLTVSRSADGTHLVRVEHRRGRLEVVVEEGPRPGAERSR
ncbi:MAG TPA: glycogen debranching N-terminal domain-containing protein [Candidatus Micrarchaeia archaeon]|nr:glycogen debranching N-terminal domain-containing protein [Candidatus Micrarchaeia archaeon]